MKVLVTGANGFLGRHVVAALLRRGHSVRALVRPAARVGSLGWPPEVELVRADLRSPGDLAPAFEGVDVLMHLAAAVTGGDEAQLSAAVVGTERLLGAMARSETKRLVLASSFSVYDWSKIRGTLDENSPLEPAPDLYDRDGYAIAKAWQEKVVRRLADQHGWDLTVLRPGFIWGEGNEYLACLGQKVGPLHLVFAPSARLPLTHVENCAQVFAAVVDDPAAIGQTINVVDREAVSAWRYQGDYLRGSKTRGVRVPVPYFVARTLVGLAHGMSRLIFRGKGKLPSILVPCRFEARFKPLTFDRTRAQQFRGGVPEIPYRDCLGRTYPEADPAVAARPAVASPSRTASPHDAAAPPPPVTAP